MLPYARNVFSAWQSHIRTVFAGAQCGAPRPTSQKRQDPQDSRQAATGAVPAGQLAAGHAAHRRFPPAPARRRHSRQPEDSAWIGYDERNFYAVFVCESPAGKTRARLSKREDVFSDDVVGVFLDTYHSRQRGYEFFVNPLGVQADAIESEGQSDDFSFDTLWYSEGRLTPEGYAAMMTIPFTQPAVFAEAAQTWGFGLFRYIPDNNENSFWPWVTQKVAGFNQQLGNMSGLEGISPGRNLQLIPYGAFGCSHFLDNPATRRPVVPEQDGSSRGPGRQGRDPRFADPGRGAQPRFQPGGIRRSAGDRQPAVRGAVPREASVLPREQQLLRHAGEPLLFAPHRGSGVWGAAHREAGPLEHRHAGHRRPGAGGEPRIPAIPTRAITRRSAWSARSASSASNPTPACF